MKMVSVPFTIIHERSCFGNVVFQRTGTKTLSQNWIPYDSKETTSESRKESFLHIELLSDLPPVVNF